MFEENTVVIERKVAELREAAHSVIRRYIRGSNWPLNVSAIGLLIAFAAFNKLV